MSLIPSVSFEEKEYDNKMISIAFALFCSFFLNEF